MKKYKLIVIGAGISGLSTAVAWLLNNEGPVLVLEKGRTAGGCVASFARKGYKFDTVQVIPDMSDLLEYLGLDLPLERYEGVLSRLFLAEGGRVRRFDIPAGEREFETLLCGTYPSEAKKIRRFFRYTRAMIDELQYLTLEPSFTDIIKILYRCPHIIRTSRDTWKRFLSRFRFSDGDLMETLDLFSSYSGLSGDRCAALLTVSAMATSLKSSWRPKKAFITVPAAMVRKIREMGGEVRTGTAVESLLIDENRIRGVVTAEGEEIASSTVVSTVDSSVFLNKLIGGGRLGKLPGPYKRAGENLKMSPSMISIHIGLDDGIDLSAYDIGGAYCVLTSGDSAYEKAYLRCERGQTGEYPGGGSFHIAFYSPSLQTGDRKQTIVIHVSPVSADYWIDLRNSDPAEYRKRKEAAADRYLRLLETSVIPGLCGHIRFLDVATPATFARYLGSPTGSCHDMMPVLSQFGLKRLPLRSPVEGLFQTKFSHGIWPAMHSGLQIMDLITGGKVMNGGARYVKR